MRPSQPMKPAMALARLRDLCSRAEYCTRELTEKMRRWGISSAYIDKITALLEEERYVDDRRYACALAHSKASYSYWGKIKIRLFLLRKGIAGDYIDEALDAIDPDEYEQALEKVLTAKKNQLGQEADTYEGRTKIYRHALSKGYESAMVAAFIRERRY